MQFYEKGLNVPAKFEKASKELCDENDKMKQFLNDTLTLPKTMMIEFQRKNFMRCILMLPD
jgi:phage/plasmid-associated DNA primase